MGPYSVSIALADSSNHILLGVVYEITLDECFYAWLGGGAYLNGNAIHVSKATDISASLIATGFPYYDYLRIKDFMKTLEHFFLYSHGVRRLGSAATDLAYVACGRFEAFYEYSLHPWDVAAGSILVSEAGGRVSDFSQNDNYLFGGEMIGSNQGIYSEFTGIIHQHMVNPERPQGS
jgi:myo-inositol-1(or 4)-monophosphatase